MRLSVGRALSEAKDVLNRDGGLIAAVALALLVLPGTLVGLAAPGPAAANATWLNWLAFFSGLLSLAGQLAISRIALGPPLTVGRAIGTGFARLPMFVAATLLWVIPFGLAISGLVAASGVSLTAPAAAMPQPNIGITLAILALLVLFLFVAVHMLFVTPATVATDLGPIGLIKRSWSLARGNALRLLVILAMVLLAAVVLVIGLGSAIGSVVILLLGRPEPWNMSALLIALLQQVLGAIVSVGLAVVVARSYAQLTGAGVATVSVPDAGGDPL